MALLEWKPEYSVGDNAIDHEHQHMIQQINVLCSKLTGTVDAEMVETVLGEIHADISAHFALVIQVDLAFVHEGIGVMDGIAVPFIRFAKIYDRFAQWPPRAIR